MGVEKKYLLFSAIALILFFNQTEIMGGETMKISSTAFKDGGKIPVPYVMPGAGGKNISIPLEWKDAPAGTKSFCLAIVDIHPVAQHWIHWLVINIPPKVSSIEEGASQKRMPKGSVELENSWGNTGYGGPQPPKGTGDHSYMITLYALNVEKLNLGESTSLSVFEKTVESKAIGSASITGLFGR